MELTYKSNQEGNRMETSVYLIPYVDGDWEGWGPVDPLMNYGNPPADLNQIETNLRKLIPFMRDQVGGRVAFGAHTSTYCRDLFYREPILTLYRELTEGGGEIVLHPHEELVGTPPSVHAKGHIEAIINQKLNELGAAAIRPTAFRMALGAFDSCIPSILQSAGIHVDLTAAPGIDLWYLCAYWRDTPFSAYYLCPVDYTHIDCDHPRTEVLEIPWGNDGLGDSYLKNFLYIEAATLSENKRVWDVIVERAETLREPQFVYCLSHLSSMAYDDRTEKLVSFFLYAQSHGGLAVTPLEAKRAYDTLRS